MVHRLYRFYRLTMRGINRDGQDRGDISNYRLQITDCRLQISDYRFQITDYRLQITDYRLQITDYRLQITDYRLQRTEDRLQMLGGECMPSGTYVPLGVIEGYLVLLRLAGALGGELEAGERGAMFFVGMWAWSAGPTLMVKPPWRWPCRVEGV